MSWIFTIPQDIIKTKQQCHTGPTPLKYADAVRQMWSEGGVRRLFKGTTPTLTRAYIMNAAVLPIFDELTKHLNKTL